MGQVSNSTCAYRPVTAEAGQTVSVSTTVPFEHNSSPILQKYWWIGGSIAESHTLSVVVRYSILRVTCR